MLFLNFFFENSGDHQCLNQHATHATVVAVLLAMLVQTGKNPALLAISEGWWGTEIMSQHARRAVVAVVMTATNATLPAKWLATPAMGLVGNAAILCAFDK